MANLTGEYDVVIEMGVNLLNAVLGAVHQNEDPHYPTVPHVLNRVIDDTHQGAGDTIPESDRTGIVSRIEAQISTPILSLPPPDSGPVVGGVLEHSAPRRTRRGAASTDPATALLLFDDPFRWPFPIPADQVTLTMRLRAWLKDHTALPDFVDGNLAVTIGLVRSVVPNVGTFLTVDRSTGPSVAFHPAAGTTMTNAQVGLVQSIARNIIRADPDPPTIHVSLPPDVRHFDFKLLPEAPHPSARIMLTLTDRAIGSQARDGVGPSFLPAGADVVVGVGADFVRGMLRSHLFQGAPSSFHFSKYGVSADVRPDWANASFDLEPGAVVFSLTGDGNISVPFYSDNFTFSVRQAFALQVAGGSLELVADGDPEVHIYDLSLPGGDYIAGKARDTIRQLRDEALAAGASQIRDALGVGKRLEDILRGITPIPAGVTLTGVEIGPGGILVPGRIGLAASAPVVVDQLQGPTVEDALGSWIPGGTVDRYVWEGFRLGHTLDTRTEEHRFVTEALFVGFVGSICLTVEGTRVGPGGALVPVSGRACVRFGPIFPDLNGVLVADEPRPGLPLGDPLEDGTVRVIGRYDPWATGRGSTKGPVHLLVHFGSDAAEVEKLLLGGLKGRKKESAVVAVGVVPAGGSRSKGSKAPDDVLVVEDRDGHWARSLGVSEAPATMLIGGGDLLWKEASALTPAKLARALDQHTEPGGEVEWQQLLFAVRPGQRAPDAPIRLSNGRELSLRRLSGRPIVLSFWTSRSPESVEHLDSLRDLPRRGDEPPPLVIAVADGETEDRVAELVKEKRYPFLVLPDPDRRFSGRFGVWCWPSTVWIGPDQRVEAVDLGLPTAPKGKPPASKK